VDCEDMREESDRTKTTGRMLRILDQSMNRLFDARERSSVRRDNQTQAQRSNWKTEGVWKVLRRPGEITNDLTFIPVQ